MSLLRPDEFAHLRDYIAEHCGMVLGEEKAYLIETRLAGLLAETRAGSFGEFLEAARADTTGALRDRIVDAITTHETLWFRDAPPWALLRETILPRLLEEILSGKRLRVRTWSTACATGQEPYSLAMCIDSLLEGRPDAGILRRRFEILATDISPSALYLAVAGNYNNAAMNRGLDETLRARYFTQRDNLWSIDPALRAMVLFRRFNLQDDFSRFGPFDLVLCRNVAIYFSVDFKRDLFARLARVMFPESILFLGAAESLMNLSTDFELREHDGVIRYIRKPGSAPSPERN